MKTTTRLFRWKGVAIPSLIPCLTFTSQSQSCRRKRNATPSWRGPPREEPPRFRVWVPKVDEALFSGKTWPKFYNWNFSGFSSNYCSTTITIILSKHNNYWPYHAYQMNSVFYCDISKTHAMVLNVTYHVTWKHLITLLELMDASCPSELHEGKKR